MLTTIERLSICSDVLFDADNWKDFHKACFVISNELIEITQSHRSRTNEPLITPDSVRSLLYHLTLLMDCRESVAEYCSHLDSVIKKTASDFVFKVNLSDLLLTLSAVKKQENLDDSIDELLHERLDNLWVAFEQLSDADKHKWIHF